MCSSYRHPHHILVWARCLCCILEDKPQTSDVPGWHQHEAFPLDGLLLKGVKCSVASDPMVIFTLSPPYLEQ